MDPIHGLSPDDIPLNFTGTEWVLIFVGAGALRLLPLLILLSGIIKLRRFPELRSHHQLLLIEIGVLAFFALADWYGGALIPPAIRNAGLYSFVWIFLIAWVAVTWIRSAIKTRLRPRWVDIPTLLTACALAASFGGLFFFNAAAP